MRGMGEGRGTIAGSRLIRVAPPHPACVPVEVLLRTCEATRGRSSGPGGQHRNKVETRVVIRHLPTGVEAHADERRELERNQAMAIRRLRLALATVARSPMGIGEIRTELWRSRCSREGRVACNPEHEDYPAMLALAMDVLDACGWDVPRAAVRLACSTSQLLKLVKDHAQAWVVMNEERAARGLHAMR